MSLLVVGCNHRSADLSLLERLAVPAEQLPKALKALTGLEHVQEAVVLSTCNRVEIYASVSRFHPGLQELRGWLAERGDIHPQDLDELQYSYHDDRAAAHLFAVTAGLDSMVLGERQVAMQVKQAMETARQEGSARRVLQRLFRQAVRVGRRVRHETAISSGASSMVDVGLDVAAARLGTALTGSHVLLVGAGKMGGLTARRLVDEAAGRIDVWNRSEDKAERLAARTGGRIIAAGALQQAVGDADLVVCTTGAPEPVLDLDLVLAAVQQRRADGHGTRPLVLLDLAMPRNVDPRCHDVPGVEVVDIADVRAVAMGAGVEYGADRGVNGDVVAAARSIVDVEAERFLAWTRASEVEPTIRDLRRTAEQVRAAELERLSGRLSSLDDRQRETVEALTRGIVNTLLHTPTVRLKELADGTGAEGHADAVRDLFGLDDPDPDREA
ncbi:glutamyl-tRNA reductase [Egicoccus sp. AB-alg6-2]|uniref:glutamyl-tRNA reductase n=1 Tax=Egicoccus sp. AB-alg6-2 TaxID=3242692 RepID=UPI00359D278C